ncbi:hypothetical protein N7452_009703 [Penicillium brevicompactum]|uniref:Uncharacterized protein n=1 Tax=Penicillium brevicompactum TaxID=5074 RepID=A0A9W9UAV6_PENBR|nr:hypothetical protein N7452_009703 [Penicillium brevicompactum]
MEDFNSETDSDYTSYWRDWNMLEARVAVVSDWAMRRPKEYRRGDSKYVGCRRPIHVSTVQRYDD